MAKEQNLFKELILACTTLVGILAFLALCGAGGYFYGEFEGRQEVLASASSTGTGAGSSAGSGAGSQGMEPAKSGPQKVIADIKDSPFVQALVIEGTKKVTGENTKTDRTMPYPNVTADHVGQIGLVKQALPPDNSESIPDTLQILGDQCFFKGDYKGARSFYLRSLAVDEAVAQRIYGENKNPTIYPCFTADDAIKRFNSIKSVTVDLHPNGAYTIVVGSAYVMHLLALMEDLNYSYEEGDKLFRASCLDYMSGSATSIPEFPPSFGSDDGVEYIMNGYKQLFSNVVRKYGQDHPYTATIIEQLALAEMGQPQWAYSTACVLNKDKKMTSEQIKEEQGKHKMTDEKRKEIQKLWRQAIAIRQNVKAANDPKIIRFDMLKLWSASPGTGTFANCCKVNGYEESVKE